MEVQCFEIKTEDDSQYDDKPSTGMFAVYDAALSALTSCCGSVVSCGSATESPCKLQIPPIKVTGKTVVLLHEDLTYYVAHSTLWTENRALVAVW